MESAVKWHEISEKAIDNGLNNEGLLNLEYVAPLSERLNIPEFDGLPLSMEMIQRALSVLGSEKQVF
jgi:hypothetical protein